MSTRFRNLLLFTILLLAACTTSDSTPSTPSQQDIQTAIAQTAAADPPKSSTSSPPDTTPASPTQPSTSFPTNTPSAPIAGRVNVTFLNLRSGPSTLHTVIQSFEAGTELIILKRVDTNDWVEVQIRTEDEAEITGWMSSSLLESDGDISTLEIMDFPEDQIIRGRVEDSNNNPIGDITIALIYRTDEEELRSDTRSNDAGDFTFYIPEELLNTLLDIQIVGLGCESIIMNSSCALEGFFNLERRAFINPPQNDPILFTYEIATNTLSGTVRNSNQATVANVLVIAERDDGAESFGTSSIDGSFDIPIGEGTWDIYTVILDPRRESERINITVTNQSPTPLDLITP